MSEKLGIKELKDVVAFGLDVGEALSDGVGIEDVSALFGIADAIAGISEVPAELADLDEAEAEELKKFVAEEFDLPDDRLEEFIEAAISAVIGLYGVYQKFVELNSEQTDNAE